MELSLSFTITLISSVIASGLQMSVFIVLYKTLRAIHNQNTNHEQSFKIQRVTQKLNLTFKFADWIASELKYFSSLYENNQKRKYILSESEINVHLTSIGNKMVTLCTDDIVETDFLKDEIERLILTLENMKSKPFDVIVGLKKLLK